jgi:diguanylate cyclase (GGDEF)-like protein
MQCHCFGCARKTLEKQSNSPDRGLVSTILIVEDSDSQRAEIRAALEESELFDRILEARDGLEGLKFLVSEPVHLVLCDLEMPGLDGTKLLRMSQQQNPSLPFLVLSAVDDADRKARLLRQGARDAITKPFHVGDLIARIQLHLELERLQEELIVKNRQLEELSVTDALTGLGNRRYLDELLRIDFLRAQRFETPLTVIMCDIDHFKRVNDQFGHAAGDRVLQQVAARLQGHLRSCDVAGRYGGDEFLLVLSGVEVEGGRMAAERWRQDIEMSPIPLEDGTQVEVTLSMGVAGHHEGLETPADLVAAADAALYRVKEAGRNRVEVDPASVSAQSEAGT